MNRDWLVRHEDGFTIEELMIVLVVSGLVVGFSFSLFQFVNKLYRSWQEESELRGEVSRSLQMMALDVLESNHIIDLGDSVLVVRKSSATILYRFTDGRIWRNNEIDASNEKLHQSVVVSRVN